MKPRWVAESLGASLLLLLPGFEPLLMPGRIALLHHRMDLQNLLGGFVIDLLLATALSLAVLALLSRLTARYKLLLSAPFVAVICFHIVYYICKLLCVLLQLRQKQLASAPQQTPQSVFLPNSLALLPLFFSILIPTVLLFLAKYKPLYGQKAFIAIRSIPYCFSFCALWILPTLAVLSLSGNSAQNFDHASALPSNPDQPRVVWLIFDELSHDQVFDHPSQPDLFRDLQKFQAQSVDFANILPFDDYTERIIPSLLEGRKIDQIRSDDSGDLLVRDNGRPDWHPFDSRNSLIGTAHDTGWNPAIAGWYNPYCRIFSSLLSACSWQPGIFGYIDAEVSGASLSDSVWKNALAMPRHYLTIWNLLPAENAMTMQATDIRDFRSVNEKARRILQEENLRFIFIHLPTPHPPGIYNRNTHQFCACGNYIDNLALTNDTLRDLLAVIDQTHSASHTTVIVSSDHSWRVPVWSAQSYWTPEEERLTHHHFDPRPVFLVRFPGSEPEMRIAAPTPEMREHDIVDSILRGKLRSEQDLIASLPASGTARALLPNAAPTGPSEDPY